MAKTNILTRQKKKKAQALYIQGRLAEAKALLEQVCNIDRQDANAWFDLAMIHKKLGDRSRARECFEMVVRLKPRLAEGHFNLGEVLGSLGMTREAVSAYRDALRIKPDNLIVHRNLNANLVSLGMYDEASAGLDRMLALSPGNLEILAAKAKVLEMKGETEKAYELLKPLTIQHPDNPKIAATFAVICKEAGDIEDAIMILEGVLENSRTGDRQEIQCEMNSALGQLYDRKANYEKAFEHFKRANELKGLTYNIDGFINHVDDTINTFTAEAVKNAPRSTIPTDAAAFIIGMPRSGTSLVEQILASHPDVTGAGELNEIVNLAAEVPNLIGSSAPYPHWLGELSADHCNKLAGRYLAQLKGISSTSRYITDKMPQNFLLLGLISLLLPQARIIHCLRDPRDTCVSCYFQAFNREHGYSYDLKTLGIYYRQYQRLMAHWEKVLDIPIYPLQYEELVTDQEYQTRRLLEFLDLPWDDSVLYFHKLGRRIQTASYDQVRRPIYKKSVGRWRHYESHLQPLLKALAG